MGFTPDPGQFCTGGYSPKLAQAAGPVAGLQTRSVSALRGWNAGIEQLRSDLHDFRDILRREWPIGLRDLLRAHPSPRQASTNATDSRVPRTASLPPSSSGSHAIHL